MSRPRRVVVLGGGVAGLSAAFGLADRGHRVSLLESRPRCGGRAFATHDQVLGRPIDNGFHVMLGVPRDARALSSPRHGGRLRARRAPVYGYRFVDGRGTSLTLSRLPGVPSRCRGVCSVSRRVRRAPAGAARDGVCAGRRALRGRSRTGSGGGGRARPGAVAAAVSSRDELRTRRGERVAVLGDAARGLLRSRRGRRAVDPKRTWGSCSEILCRRPSRRRRPARARVRELEVRGGRVACVVLGDGERVEVGDDELVVSAMPWFALARASGRCAGGRRRAAQRADRDRLLRRGRRGRPARRGGRALVGAAPFHFLLRTPGDDPRRRGPLGRRPRVRRDVCRRDRRDRACRVGRYFPGSIWSARPCAFARSSTRRLCRRQVRCEQANPGASSAALKTCWCGDWTATASHRRSKGPRARRRRSWRR